MSEIVEHAKAFIEKTREKRALEAQIKELNRELGILEEVVIDGFADAEIANINIGGALVYISKMLWASPMDGKASMPALVARMREHGHDDLVETSIGSQKLSAFVRSEEADGHELPPELAEVIKTTEVYKVKVRKS